MVRDFFQSLYTLAIDMGFYMTIGLVLVGMLNIFIKKQWIAKHLGGTGIWPVIKASLLGVPLPLCSCGVVPTGLYLKDKGASDSSAVSFLISTPQTGADSIIATYGLMGPLFAWYRPLAAFVSGIVGGASIRLFNKKPATHPSKLPVEDDESAPIKQRAVKSFKYAFGEFVDDIAVHFIIGLAIAALIAVMIPADFIESIGLSSGILSMLIMIVIGAPMYICSTSSIPIAVMLMVKGLSPGAAFVFLFMGPFTNAASLILISKKFGRKNTVIYFLSAAVSAMAFGVVLDAVVNAAGVEFSYLTARQAEMAYSPVQIVVAAVFLMLVLFYAVRKLVRYSQKIKAKKSASDETYKTYAVDGMDCKNCAAGLEASIREEDGVLNAEIDFDSKELKIWGKVSEEKLEQMVKAHGYSLS